MIPAAAGILAVFAIWYGICEAGLFNAYVLPPPAKVFGSFLDMCRRGELAGDIGISMLIYPWDAAGSHSGFRCLF